MAISGAINCQNGPVFGAINCQNGLQILYGIPSYDSLVLILAYSGRLLGSGIPTETSRFFSPALHYTWKIRYLIMCSKCWPKQSACAALWRCCGRKIPLLMFFFSLSLLSPDVAFLLEGVIVELQNFAWGFK
jgi:hypothetical protein